MSSINTNKSQYTRNLIEASPDPFIVINEQGKITDMNEAFLKATDKTRKQLLHTEFSLYFTDPKKACEVYQEVFKKGFVFNYPLTIIDHTNTEVTFNGATYKDDNGNILGAVVVARVVTEQRRTEKELREVIENAEHARIIAEKEKEKAEVAKTVAENEKEKAEVARIIAEKEKEKAEVARLTAQKEKEKAEIARLTAQKEKEKAEVVRLIAQKEKEKAEVARLAAQKEKEKAEVARLTAQKEKEKAEVAKSIAEEEKEKAEIARIIAETEKEKAEVARVVAETEKEKAEIARVVAETEKEKAEVARLTAQKEKEKAEIARLTAQKEKEKAEVVRLIAQKEKEKAEVARLAAQNEKEKAEVARLAAQKEKEKAEVARIVAQHEKDRAEVATVVAEEAQNKAELATIVAENATIIAEDAVKSKQQFLSNMSHEIRTPMNSIIGFTKVLLKTELSVKQAEYLNAIKISGDALIVLINDILDLAKVDAGKMTFEQNPFKLKDSIGSMIHLFEPKIQEKNLKLIKEYDKRIPNVLLGDPIRLHQIILNLVSNAVKFTSEGSITVSVNLINEDEHKVTIQFSIKDTGIGIKAEKIDGIFENFQQASSGTSRIYGGTGLGLAIVKQLIVPQGGSISVASTLNEGSTFSFILDFQKTNATTTTDIEIMEQDTEKKNIRVLVVEDIALNQLLMKTLLDDFGFERDIADNGKIAIEKLAQNKYDIILMDLQMPQMNGFEATAYIRNVLKLDIPIIALTADVTTVDVAKCKAVGMNDYIAKPVDERLLYSKIIGLFQKPTPAAMAAAATVVNEEIKQMRYVDLAYLIKRTKSDPALMMEMISLYLEQTPPLISTMKQSFEAKDWKTLYSAVHKMIPSFSIMGISSDFENIAKKVQDYASTQSKIENIDEMVLKLENVCTQACQELILELDLIKNKK